MMHGTSKNLQQMAMEKVIKYHELEMIHGQ
jgi:hypothetical protein